MPTHFFEVQCSVFSCGGEAFLNGHIVTSDHLDAVGCHKKRAEELVENGALKAIPEAEGRQRLAAQDESGGVERIPVAVEPAAKAPQVEDLKEGKK